MAPGGIRTLRVYQLAYKLAMQIFNETKTFPHDERYSMTSQIRRSSRSVAANLAEGIPQAAISEHVREQVGGL